MTYDFKNKIIIVTGASSGIGKSCVEHFIEEGAQVVLVSRDQQRMKSVVQNMDPDKLLIVPTDVSQQNQVEQMVQTAVDRFGRVDILINNAGIGIKGSVVTTPLAEYEKVVRTNIFGVLYCIRSVYPIMKEQGTGVIVNVSSVAGFKGFYDSGMYSSTKFAVNGMSESLGESARKDNIDVILVCPGKVETEFESNVVYREEPLNNKRAGVSADKIAKAIIRAIKKNQKMVVVGKNCIPLYLLNRISPGLANQVIRHIY